LTTRGAGFGPSFFTAVLIALTLLGGDDREWHVILGLVPRIHVFADNARRG
jgi:hypothetical protein